MANLTDLTANALNAIEPQRVNNIILHLTSAPTGANWGDTAGAPTLGGGSGESVLALSAEQFPLPKNNQGVISLGYLNEKRHFAGNVEFDDISIVCRDYVNTDAYKILWAWRKAVYNVNSGKVGFATTYKGYGYISEYAPDGTVERQLNLFGIWPMSLDPGDADMNGEDYVKITCSFKVDKSWAATAVGAVSAYPTPA